MNDPEDLLRTLDSFVKPLSPEEISASEQPYRSAGTLDPERLFPSREPLPPYAPWDAGYSRRALADGSGQPGAGG